VGVVDGIAPFLRFFNAETEEELAELEKLGLEDINMAIEEYRTVVTLDKYQELEDMRDRAGMAEAAAKRKVIRERDAYWQREVAALKARLAQYEPEVSKL
jgi:hypothetical protein